MTGKSGVYLAAEGWTWRCFICNTEEKKNFGKGGREPARAAYKAHRKKCRKGAEGGSGEVAGAQKPAEAATAQQAEPTAPAPAPTPAPTLTGTPAAPPADKKEGSTPMARTTKKTTAKKTTAKKTAAKKKVTKKKVAKKTATKKTVAKKKATPRRSDGKKLFRFALIKNSRGTESGIWVSLTGHFSPARAKKLGVKRAKRWGEVYAKSHATALKALRGGGGKWFTPSTAPSPSKKTKGGKS